MMAVADSTMFKVLTPSEDKVAMKVSMKVKHKTILTQLVTKIQQKRPT